MVGVDVGCDMETVRVAERDVDFDKLDALIRERIPFGRMAREKGASVQRANQHSNPALHRACDD